MSFTSFEFLIFGAAFYIVYPALVRSNPIPLITTFSLFFYAWRDPKYLPLILFSAAIDFFAAIRIEKSQSKVLRKTWLLLSIILNIGLLFYFKYMNFFVEQVSALTGAEIAWRQLILPLGISFYTLQTVGYTVDVFRGKVKPERNFLTYVLYVSFFPQLVAGPIERAGRLLPQLRKIGAFDFANFPGAMLLVLWGLFMKLVVADNLLPYLRYAFDPPSSGYLFLFTSWLGLFQVYCDFGGYTMIALGLARGMGVKLSENFRQPLLATTLSGFWQCWHITLTRWIIDYVHIPIARRFPREPWRSCSAIGAMCLVGFWHGASWNYILFGLMHGLGIRLWNPIAGLFDFLPLGRRLRSFCAWVCLSIFVALSAPVFWIHDLGQLRDLLGGIFSLHSGAEVLRSLDEKTSLMFGMLFALIVIAHDIKARRKSSWCVMSLADSSHIRAVLPISLVLVVLIVLFANREVPEFVYFQF